MSIPEKTIIAYTSAKEAYDGFGTKTIDFTDYQTSNGDRIRKVAIPEKAYEWQTIRYASGNRPAFSESQFEEFKTSIFNKIPSQKMEKNTDTSVVVEVNANPILKENTEIQNPEIKSNSYIPESDSCRSLDTTVPVSMRYEMKKAIETIDRRVNGVDEYVAEKLGYIVGNCSIEERKEGLKCLCDAFSAEQVDAIAVAIYNIENRQQAVIIGDQTGIGKGRIAAGVIRYGMKNGVKPIFLTEKPNLFSDIFRDLVAIGSDDAIPLEILDGYKEVEKRTQKTENPEDVSDETEDDSNEEDGIEIIKVPVYKKNKDYPDSYTYVTKDENGKDIKITRRRVTSAVPFIVNGSGSKTYIKDEEGNIIYKGLSNPKNNSVINSRSVPKEYDFIVATYSQFGAEEENEKKSFLRSVSVDNIFILDEAHNASGSSFSGQFLTDVLKSSKGVTFLSATFAKRPDNMPIYASKTSIQDANMSSEQLVEAIEKGGVALQEILSSQLVSEGQMIRRERSFEGIEVNYINLDSSQLTRGFPNLDREQEHKAISDISTEIVRDIMAFQKEYVDPVIKSMDKEHKGEMGQVEARKGTASGGIKNTPAFNGIFQVINQLLFSIKAESVAEVAIQRLKEGKKPVIAFANTMESFLDSYTGDDGTPVKSGDIINIDFSKVLDRRLESVLKYTIIQPNGEKTYSKINVFEMDAGFVFEYNKIREKIKKASTGITFSPIDIIRKKLQDAGFSVEEVTGRTTFVDIINDNEGVVKTRPAANATDAFRRFNNNESDCLMINQSGSTGASAHAIPTKKVSKDQVKQRVMIILQAELNINTEVQKRGRINRTGQILKPIYDYVTSAIPAEKRLMMMLQKKLKSLDANTTSNQKQSNKVFDVNDFLNKYGDIVVIEYLKENKDVNNLIGDPLKLESSSADGKEALEGKKTKVEIDAAHQVSGRIAILSTKMQEDFYREMTERYASLVEYLVQTGEYDLEVESLNLEAESISKTVIIEGKDGGSVFSRNSILEKCEVNALKKPFKRVEIDAMMKEVLGDTFNDGKELQESQKAQFAEWVNTNVAKDLKEDLERWQRVLDGITAEKQYGKLETDLQKKQYIEQRQSDIEEAQSLSQERIKTSYRNRKEVVDNLIKFFYTGKIIGYPTRVYSIDNSFIKGVVIGLHIDQNLKNPYAPSAIKIRIALASSDKYVALPASKIDIVSMIKSITYSEIMSYEQNDFLNKWDEVVKSKTADRQTRYIVTGNILQAFARPELKGKLISYTVKGGGVKKGILLPEEFNPDRQKSKEGSGASQIRVTVPIEKALPIIRSAQTNRNIVTNDGITLIKKYDGYKVIVGSNKQKYGKFYLNETLNKLTVSGRFDKSGGNMVSDIEDRKIDNFVSYLGDEFSSTIDLIQSEYDLIKGERGADVDYDDVTKESTEIILDKFTEDDIEGERLAEQARQQEAERQREELQSAERRLEEARITERKLEIKRRLVRLASLLENGGGSKYERGGGIDPHDAHIDRINDLEVSHKMDMGTINNMVEFMQEKGVYEEWNDFNQMKVKRTQFEEEVYEYANGGSIEDFAKENIGKKVRVGFRKEEGVIVGADGDFVKIEYPSLGFSEMVNPKFEEVYFINDKYANGGGVGGKTTVVWELTKGRFGRGLFDEYQNSRVFSEKTFKKIKLFFDKSKEWKESIYSKPERLEYEPTELTSDKITYNQDGFYFSKVQVMAKGGDVKKAIFTSKEGEIYSVEKDENGKYTVYSESKNWAKRNEFPNGFQNESDAILVAKELAGITPEFSNGGPVDLFNDEENIPSEVMEVLSRHESSFEDGDYEGMNIAKSELEQIGYTFDFYTDGSYNNLRPVSEINNEGSIDYPSQSERKNKSYYHLIWEENGDVKDLTFESKELAEAKYEQVIKKARVATLQKDTFNAYGHLSTHNTYKIFPKN